MCRPLVIRQSRRFLTRNVGLFSRWVKVRGGAGGGKRAVFWPIKSCTKAARVCTCVSCEMMMIRGCSSARRTFTYRCLICTNCSTSPYIRHMMSSLSLLTPFSPSELCHFAWNPKVDKLHRTQIQYALDRRTYSPRNRNLHVVEPGRTSSRSGL